MTTMKKPTKRKKKPGGGRPKCECTVREEVRSASGTTLYGWRCPYCAKQWQLIHCDDCKKPSTLVARINRTKHVCKTCVKVRRAKALAKPAQTSVQATA